MRNQPARIGALALLVLFAFTALPARIPAAEATTGTILGAVLDASCHAVGGARILATSASGRYAVIADASGRFTILGVVPDTYSIEISATGYQIAARAGVVVLPGQSQRLSVALSPSLKTIARARSRAGAFTVGSTSDTFTVTGNAATARSPVESSSGLGDYTAGTVQGAIAAVPGVDQDSFANAILRGGKVDDAVFDYDSVPIPQGLIAEPGGNVVGAQLFTTGIVATTTTLAGYQGEGQNALGGVVDQIPAIGTYPGITTLDFADGARALDQSISFSSRWATPDLRWRYAVAASFGSEYFAYGDGSTFYPAEAGTYGLALQSRGQSSAAGNVHFQLTPHDDFSVDMLFGEANYQQYGSPYVGETFGANDPNAADPDGIVKSASGLRGTYDIVKAQWVHTYSHSLSRLQVYQSQFGSQAGGPFWDDDAYPDGTIELSAQQGGRENGLSYDIDDLASDRHQLKYGLQASENNSFLNQVVNTSDGTLPTPGISRPPPEYIESNPTLFTYLAYFGDVWTLSPRLDLSGTLRMTQTHIVPSFGTSYDVGAIDPHFAGAYRIGGTYAVRVTFDHTTVAPKPLEADRTDTDNPVAFAPLAPEVSNDFTYSFEGGGKTPFRATYYDEQEYNRIDVLPVNFRSVVSSGASPSAFGVPTNAGELKAHGFEFWTKAAGFTLDTNLIRAYSSSASQFAYNDLNAPAVAAGHLFPVSYEPDLSLLLSYELDLAHRRLQITPSLSYESGYPYGNGKMVWIFNPLNGKPEPVPNDNYVNPGYNYYFLANPSLPFNATSNPYAGSLGTPEGNDPNTLRTPPQILVSLHVENDISNHLTAILDVINLFGTSAPTQLQGNPYLIGPPGYVGGNPYYAAAYQAAGGYAEPYLLGNGVPTNNGQSAALPWNYGRAGYVPMAYPLARSFLFTLRYRL